MDYKPIDYTEEISEIRDTLIAIANSLERLTDYSAEIVRRDMFGPHRR